MFYLKSTNYLRFSATAFLSPKEIDKLKINDKVTIVEKNEKHECVVVWDKTCVHSLACECIYVDCCLCRHLYRHINSHEKWEAMYGKEYKEKWEPLGYPKPYNTIKPKIKLDLLKDLLV